MKLISSSDPILKQTATDWDFEIDLNADQLEAEMIELMTLKNAIGLAANQIGLLKRVFAIHLSTGEKFAMFNPEILSVSDTLLSKEEGCLSFPNLFLTVNRPSKVSAKYLDKSNNSCTIELTGIDARCFLHELDHLNGICFTDGMSQLKLALAIKKQRKLNGRTK